MLVHNARWFIRVRWVAVAALILAGLVSKFAPFLITSFGLIPPHRWPLLLAAVLAAANVSFALLARGLTEKSSDRLVAGNIWFQIVVDLFIVTLLVHFVGSTSTFISFTYLLHIVLACIFLAPAQSLLVTLIAATLYLGCVRLEGLELWPACGMVPVVASSIVSRNLALIFALSAVFVWLVVWYLVSTLSKIVRNRGRLLETANQRLIVADEEKNRLMLCTAHDLKAPFSGIESNIQRLKAQYWGELSDPVKDLVDRIETRGVTLTDRIQDILLLGDLRTKTEVSAVPENVDIACILKDVSEELDGKAQKRKVRVQLNVPTLTVQGVSRHFFILFSNLLSNAISYSAEGSVVEVTLQRQNKDVQITVLDSGIGIKADALPRIFDEYYRTAEAARCNPGSTGLGLAIVKEIAQKEGLGITVASEPGKGSAFSVTLPAARCIVAGKEP